GHGVDEFRLDLDTLLRIDEPAVLRQRPENRLARGRAVEVVEAKVVAEQIRDPSLEPVELCQRVLAQREEDVHTETRPPDQLRQLVCERAWSLLALVVEEVLLGLVEDQIEIAAGERAPPL